MNGRRMITLEQSILEAARALPPEKQKELLEHAQCLREDVTPAEEIKENRREVWKNVPPDF